MYKQYIKYFIISYALLFFVIFCSSGNNKKYDNVEEFTIDSRTINLQNVVAVLPNSYSKKSDSKKTYPMVILFSGRGETVKGNLKGARGWVYDYYITNGIKALTNGHLNRKDFKDLINEDSLNSYNQMLSSYPYQEMFLICPFTRDGIAEQQYSDEQYEYYIITELLEAVKKRYPIDVKKIGVGGVSLGGGTALYFAMKYPTIFNTVCALQPVVFKDELIDLIRQNKTELNRLKIDLVTSKTDHLKKHVGQVSDLLNSEGIKHDFTLLEGPHDYIFNQGPGQIELLMYFNMSFQAD